MVQYFSYHHIKGPRDNLGRPRNGFTIVELLVAVAIGMSFIGFISLSFVNSRRQLAADLVRVESNANLQLALELVGSELRSLGARLVENFPALIVIDGDNNDQLIARRSVVSGLSVCQEIKAGNSTSQIIIATDALGSVKDSNGSTIMVDNGVGGEVPLLASSCVSDSTTIAAASEWTEAYKPLPTLIGYLFNRANSAAHPFSFSNFAPGASFALVGSPKGGSWSGEFTPLTSSAYLIEEVNFRISADNVLEAVRSDFPAHPMALIPDVERFDITVTVNDVDPVSGVESTITKKSFQGADNWRKIDAISVTLTIRDNNGKLRTGSSSFTPRNVFSAKWH